MKVFYDLWLHGGSGNGRERHQVTCRSSCWSWDPLLLPGLWGEKGVSIIQWWALMFWPSTHPALLHSTHPSTWAAVRRPSKFIWKIPRVQRVCAPRLPGWSAGDSSLTYLAAAAASLPPKDRAPPLPVSLPCKGQMGSRLSGQTWVTYKHGTWYTFQKASGQTDCFVCGHNYGETFFTSLYGPMC